MYSNYLLGTLESKSGAQFLMAPVRRRNLGLSFGLAIQAELNGKGSGALGNPADYAGRE